MVNTAKPYLLDATRTNLIDSSEAQCLHDMSTKLIGFHMFELPFTIFYALCVSFGAHPGSIESEFGSFG